MWLWYAVAGCHILLSGSEIPKYLLLDEVCRNFASRVVHYLKSMIWHSRLLLWFCYKLVFKRISLWLQSKSCIVQRKQYTSDVLVCGFNRNITPTHILQLAISPARQCNISLCARPHSPFFPFCTSTTLNRVLHSYGSVREELYYSHRWISDLADFKKLVIISCLSNTALARWRLQKCHMATTLPTQHR